ncbi:MAG: deoxyribose-phosphate aldolase [Alphaproteobacteria bacterium]|nr:deoxyribose-phosphate aldolase [Alphaproteobacteria bacterium]
MTRPDPSSDASVHSLHQPTRNPGLPLDVSRLENLAVNTSAVERRAATLATRRSLKKDHQAAWLLKAVTCIDLTTLAGDDTPGRVERLCAKARQPVRRDLLEGLGVADLGLSVGAVCVYHEMVPAAVAALADSGIPVAAVSAGFPAGLSWREGRIAEVEASVAAGAAEIDIVINRGLVLSGDWQALHDEVRAFREAAGPAHLKAILGTGDLGPLRQVARASQVAMMAGADFIKTSTGKESINATLPVSLVMLRQIRAFEEETGQRIGFKPAGGISTAKTILAYQIMMREDLGRPWLDPTLFRVGASGLLGDIERQLEHHLSGAYSASHRHPMG